MTEERLKLHEKAETRVNAIIDTLSQDKGGLADKLKQEDVKDFLVSLWVDCSTEATKELEKENAELKADNDARKFAMTMSEKVEKKLRQENKKAKELLKRYVPYRQITDSKAYKDLADETELFLNSEVEKC